MPLDARHRHRPSRRREREVGPAVLMLRAAGLGLVLAAASVIFQRPAVSTWRTLSEDGSVRLSRERSVYYSGCDEARRAGAAPIYAGEPGYRSGMDGDGDGIACEPYPR